MNDATRTGNACALKKLRLANTERVATRKAVKETQPVRSCDTPPARSTSSRGTRAGWTVSPQTGKCDSLDVLVALDRRVEEGLDAGRPHLCTSTERNTAQQHQRRTLMGAEGCIGARTQGSAQSAHTASVDTFRRDIGQQDEACNEASTARTTQGRGAASSDTCLSSSRKDQS